MYLILKKILRILDLQNKSKNSFKYMVNDMLILFVFL